jgi:3-dehydroquinate dehydratase-2
MATNILLIHGPNLNLLGTREPSVYGSTTLPQLEDNLKAQAETLEVSFAAFQSNHEGAIIDRIQQARGTVNAIIINAGAYTHTSVAIRDALLSVEIPFIEVHVSNVHARESFRHHSYLADKAVAVIAGMGPFGYEAALNYLVKHMKVKKSG